MQAPSAPPAPDPAATAAAQSKSNRETAITQYGLSATNQVGPQGTLTYKQIGTWPDGTPRYEATTALSPEQQQLYDLGNRTQQNVGRIGVEQSGRIGNLLNTPISLNNEATEGRLMELGRKRLDPLFAQRSDALETDLINRGIRPGSEAYQRARGQFGEQQNDAYNELLLKGRGEAVQEALTERNQPINEISALLSGSQVSQPNFRATPTPGVAPTDVIGAQQQALNQQNIGFQAQQQQNMGLMSGLFGLGKTALGGWMFSDRNLKTDIKKVAQIDHGLGLYKYRFKDDGPRGMMQLGLMAQEVEKIMPEAVAETPAGKMVDYSAVAEVVGESIGKSVGKSSDESAEAAR